MYNYGIDLLKIVGMLFITTLHVLGHGGVLSSAQGNAYYFLWLVEIVAYCGVNVYAIISGFVSYKETEKGWKWNKYIALWLQVVAFGVAMTALVAILVPGSVSAIMFQNAFFPNVKGAYWYFGAYTIVFLLMPFLDMAVRKISGKTILMIVFLITCYMTYPGEQADVFSLASGYSYVWLSLLYMVGAVIKKEKWYEKCNKCWITIFMFGSIIGTWVWKIWIGKHIGDGLEWIFISYLSPTILCVAICLVLLFVDLKVKKRWIRTIGASTFGVYLFHDQNVFRSVIMNNRFQFIATLPLWKIPFVLLACIVTIFMIGILFDKIWQFLYRKSRLCLLVDKLAG